MITPVGCFPVACGAERARRSADRGPQGEAERYGRGQHRRGRVPCRRREGVDGVAVGRSSSQQFQRYGDLRAAVVSGLPVEQPGVDELADLATHVLVGAYHTHDLAGPHAVGSCLLARRDGGRPVGWVGVDEEHTRPRSTLHGDPGGCAGRDVGRVGRRRSSTRVHQPDVYPKSTDV